MHECNLRGVTAQVNISHEDPANYLLITSSTEPCFEMRRARALASFVRMRMHPWEAALPIEPGAFVPWMKYHGSRKYIFTPCIGLRGSPAMRAFSLRAHSLGGGTHLGFQSILPVQNRPVGVGCLRVPTATP